MTPAQHMGMTNQVVHLPVCVIVFQGNEDLHAEVVGEPGDEGETTARDQLFCVHQVLHLRSGHCTDMHMLSQHTLGSLTENKQSPCTHGSTIMSVHIEKYRTYSSPIRQKNTCAQTYRQTAIQTEAQMHSDTCSPRAHAPMEGTATSGK
jgi:hypothetical protein